MQQRRRASVNRNKWTYHYHHHSKSWRCSWIVEETLKKDGSLVCSIFKNGNAKIYETLHMIHYFRFAKVLLDTVGMRNMPKMYEFDCYLLACEIIGLMDPYIVVQMPPHTHTH